MPRAQSVRPCGTNFGHFIIECHSRVSCSHSLVRTARAHHKLNSVHPHLQYLPSSGSVKPWTPVRTQVTSVVAVRYFIVISTPSRNFLSFRHRTEAELLQTVYLRHRVKIPCRLPSKRTVQDCCAAAAGWFQSRSIKSKSAAILVECVTPLVAHLPARDEVS